MWCPFCSHENTRVVDSRLTRDGMQIRRRRQCEECGSRFNTYEGPELKAPRIIKTDGGREAFSEDKLREGMLRALAPCCAKFPAWRIPKYPVHCWANGSCAN
jgi:transcriptional repressor NrdR